MTSCPRGVQVENTVGQNEREGKRVINVIGFAKACVWILEDPRQARERVGDDRNGRRAASGETRARFIDAEQTAVPERVGTALAAQENTENVLPSGNNVVQHQTVRARRLGVTRKPVTLRFNRVSRRLVGKKARGAVSQVFRDGECLVVRNQVSKKRARNWIPAANHVQPGGIRAFPERRNAVDFDHTRPRPILDGSVQIFMQTENGRRFLHRFVVKG